MISQEIRAGRSGGARKAKWITEEMAPLLPRNIYGVSKLAAEHLCRMVHGASGLPIVILRTARFFPEEDDMSHEIIQSGALGKVAAPAMATAIWGDYYNQRNRSLVLALDFKMLKRLAGSVR